MDIRQSDNWSKYLESIGWKSYRLKNGVMLGHRDIKIGKLVKIQRPRVLTKKDLDEIEKYCKSIHSLFIKIEPPADQDISVLERSGYIKSYYPLAVPSTIFIDLSLSEEELWRRVSRSGKYGINRSKREGSKVEFFQNPDDSVMEVYYKLCKETGKRKGFYVQPYSDLKAKVDAWKDKSCIALVFDKKDNVAGGKLYLCFENTVWYANGGTTEDGLHGRSGYLLMWESILYFKKQDYKLMDLEGKEDDRFPTHTKNWTGFTHFKNKFNGISVEFPYPYIKYTSLGFKIMNKIHELPL